jgi:multidrug efflux pump subunit AcrB
MGLNLTMPGVIGIIGLAGVIVNDGIIMMDFIQKAKTIQEIKKYALLRIRPIMLTSFTTILGLSSLIFFASGQALILQPMAVSLGFGILWATVLNLYYLPLVYSVIYLKDGKKYDYVKLMQTIQKVLKINITKLLKVISQKLNKI